MPHRTVEAVRLSFLLRRCARSSALTAGRQAHALAIVLALLPRDATLHTDVILLYASNPSTLGHARLLFDEMPNTNMYAWNIVFSMYARNSLHAEAIALLPHFYRSHRVPDHFTLPSLFKACGGCGRSCLGTALHAVAIVLGFHAMSAVSGSILDMYGKLGSLIDARKMFEEMPERDFIAWNSLISGNTSSGYDFEALRLFKTLQFSEKVLNFNAVPSILNICSRLGDWKLGKEIHGHVLRLCVFDLDVVIGNSLIDMYSKCGLPEDARSVFSRMNYRNIVTWSTFIACLASHGDGEESVKLYKEMIHGGFRPNETTFTSVLSGCCHSGLVDEGRKVFYSMKSDYGLDPSIEHFACIADLLGRSGSTKEALRFVENMPFEASASVWGALLAASSMHGDVRIGEISAHKLFEMEPDNPSNYIALRSIYNKAGFFDHEAKISSRMKEKGMIKNPGCSWVVFSGKPRHVFYQGNVTNASYRRIHMILLQLHLWMASETILEQSPC